jgi:hypothetical protein
MVSSGKSMGHPIGCIGPKMTQMTLGEKECSYVFSVCFGLFWVGSCLSYGVLWEVHRASHRVIWAEKDPNDLEWKRSSYVLSVCFGLFWVGSCLSYGVLWEVHGASHRVHWAENDPNDLEWKRMFLCVFCVFWVVLSRVMFVVWSLMGSPKGIP